MIVGTDVTGRPAEPVWVEIEWPEPEITWPAVRRMLRRWFTTNILFVSHSKWIGTTIYIHFLPWIVIELNFRKPPADQFMTLTLLGITVRMKPTPGFRGESSPEQIERNRRRWRFGY